MAFKIKRKTFLIDPHCFTQSVVNLEDQQREQLCSIQDYIMNDVQDNNNHNLDF